MPKLKSRYGYLTYSDYRVWRDGPKVKAHIRLEFSRPDRFGFGEFGFIQMVTAHRVVNQNAELFYTALNDEVDNGHARGLPYWIDTGDRSPFFAVPPKKYGSMGFQLRSDCFFQSKFGNGGLGMWDIPTQSLEYERPLAIREAREAANMHPRVPLNKKAWMDDTPSRDADKPFAHRFEAVVVVFNGPHAGTTLCSVCWGYSGDANSCELDEIRVFDKPSMQWVDTMRYWNDRNLTVDFSHPSYLNWDRNTRLGHD